MLLLPRYTEVSDVSCLSEQGDIPKVAGEDTLRRLADTAGIELGGSSED